MPISCPFLQFSTLESCCTWFTISYKYPSAYVYSYCPVMLLCIVFKLSVYDIINHFLQFDKLRLSFNFCNKVRVWFNSACDVCGYGVLSFLFWFYFVKVLMYNSLIVIRTNSFFYWENLKSGSFRGYENTILSLFSYFWDFLSFSSVFYNGILLYLVYD